MTLLWKREGNHSAVSGRGASGDVGGWPNSRHPSRCRRRRSSTTSEDGTTRFLNEREFGSREIDPIGEVATALASHFMDSINGNGSPAIPKPSVQRPALFCPLSIAHRILHQRRMARLAIPQSPR